MIFVAVFSFFS